MTATVRAWSVVALLLALLALGAAPAAADGIERYALIVGNNLGARHETPLRHAQADARKLAEVLGDSGGVPADQLVVLLEQDAVAVKDALEALHARISGRRRRGGGDVLLVVYYSGHGDATALHLGDSRLKLRELERLVDATPATARVLVVDSCRSGQLTRAKGGRPIQPFAVRFDDRLATRGLAIITSASASENAQESDALGGSFFTHYLVSGLRGAADANDDGRVTLSEAYRHAYDATVRASSQVTMGTQHPTYRYELRGQQEITLTQPFDGTRRAVLELPPGRGFLVLRGSAEGAVIAEVGERDAHRRLGLTAGTYFLRGRGRSDLREGTVSLVAGRRLAVAESALTAVPYADARSRGAELTLATPIRASWQLEASALARLTEEGGGGFAVGASWRPTASRWAAIGGVLVTTSSSSPFAGGRVEWARHTGFLAGSVRLTPPGRLSAELLAGARLGVLRARGQGYVRDETSTRSTAGAVAALRGSYPLRRLGLLFELSATQWLLGKELRFSPDVGYSVPSREVSFAVGLTWPL